MNDSKLERQINDTASDAISKIEELEEELSEKNDEISALRSTIEDRELEISDMENEIFDLKEQLELGKVPTVSIKEQYEQQY